MSPSINYFSVASNIPIDTNSRFDIMCVATRHITFSVLSAASINVKSAYDYTIKPM